MSNQHWVQYRDNYGVNWVDTGSKEEIEKVTRDLPPDYTITARGENYANYLSNPTNWKKAGAYGL